MNDEEEIVVELQDNALSHPPYTENPFPIGRADGRIDRTEEKWLGDPGALEWLSHDAGLKRLDVDGYVRQLGHLWGRARLLSGLPNDGLSRGLGTPPLIERAVIGISESELRR
jgi:hypothetical protein